MDTHEFRLLGHQMVEWIASYRERMAALPVMSPLAPGEVKRQLPPAAPVEGQGLEGILAELDRVVLPGITHWCHPGFFAYFPANADLASVLADRKDYPGAAQQMRNYLKFAGSAKDADEVRGQLQQLEKLITAQSEPAPKEP